MNVSPQSVFDLASRRLEWLSNRQRVISENIANADTAGYRAKDVQSFESYLDASEPGSVGSPVEVFEQKSTWGDTLSGNSVVLEEQMINATDTASQYRLASNLYRKAYQLVLAAAGTR
jgi:flagellar basal-body rod protein FlgB